MYPSRFISVLAFTAITVSALPLAKRAVDFYNPTDGGGSFLNESGDGGEPLNVIISGLSSPEVLTPNGLLNFARAIGYSEECLGLHQGGAEPANLGDGRGYVPEQSVIREQFFIPVVGTCLESLVGGNHFRVYPQTGPQANSGALFLAVSKEEDVAEGHDIVPDGYDIGRDKPVVAAVGESSYLGTTYTTVVEAIPNLLAAGSQGINHGIAQDGIVKMLTVTIEG